jgi:hypothetical protein
MDYSIESKLQQWDSTFPALNLFNYSLFDRWSTELKYADRFVGNDFNKISVKNSKDLIGSQS